MDIVKRNGVKQSFNPNKIVKRIKDQCDNLNCDYDRLSIDVIAHITNNITTIEIDNITAKLANNKTPIHPDYSILASRILISSLHKTINKDIKKYFNRPELDVEIKEKFKKWQNKVTETIDYDRDFNFDYPAIKTLLETYLMIDELPQQMYTRVALYLADSEKEFVEYYNAISNQYISLATPILLNGGKKNSNMISCCLIDNFEDSLEGIMTTMNKAARYSADAAGIGINVTNIRSKESTIGIGKGKASGIVKYAKIAETIANTFNQKGARSGAFALYLDIWHLDIVDFLELKLQTGDVKLRTRDLFTAVNVRNNFMKAVENDTDYYLFCPNEIKKILGIELYHYNNEEFEYWYNQAVLKVPYKTIKARSLMEKIITSQLESGTPYVLFIDNMNKNVPYKENVNQSNLCVAGNTKVLTINGELEIKDLINLKPKIWNGYEWSEVNVFQTGQSKNWYKVYTTQGDVKTNDLHVWHLKDSNFITTELLFNLFEQYGHGVSFDIENYQIDGKDIDCSIINVERLIDVEDKTYCLYEPLNHTFIANGVMTGNCIEINIPTNANEIAQCCLGSIVLHKYLVNDNNDIDNELLKKHCDIIIRMLNKVIDYNDYSSIEGSYSGNKRRSIGVGIQGFADLLNRLGHSFDSQEAKNINIELFKSINDYLWNSSIELNEKYKIDLSSQFKDNFQHKQAVNTTVSALMPTAGTSVLTSSSEMFEPYTSNILVRKLTNSEFVVWNKNLVKDLEKENLFTEEIKSEIIKQEGSVQFLNNFNKREVYKTVWEYKQKDLIDLCIDRQPYISMSQSMNLYYAEPTYNKISSALLYGWKKGLNTGVYYTRTKNKVKANTQIINTVEDKNYKIECVGGCNG